MYVAKKRDFAWVLAAFACILAAAALAGLGAPSIAYGYYDHDYGTERALQLRFTFVANCTKRCADDRCEAACLTGSVLAFDVGTAKVVAEALLRADVQKSGSRVVEGTVDVRVELFRD
jgi:hypothetical protein